MGKIVIRIIFVLSLSFNIAFLAHLFLTQERQQATDKPGPVVAEMDISPAQVEKIRYASAHIDQENRELSSRVATYQQELMATLQAQAVDTEKVSRIIKDISSLQQQMQENIIKKILICKKHLSPHQCTCFIDKMSEKMNITPTACEHGKDCHCQHRNHESKKK